MTFIANPYVRETPLAFGAGSLALRASANRGRWALITDGEVVVTEQPTVEEVDAADVALRGGYPTEVTEEVANLLIADGYSHWVTEV